MKKRTGSIAVIIFVILFNSCQQAVNIPPENAASDRLTETQYRTLTNGAYLSGSLLYHPDNPEISRLATLKTLSIRLAGLTSQEVQITGDLDQIDANGTVSVRKNITSSQTEYQEIPDTILTGTLKIDRITPEEITVSFTLYNSQRIKVKDRKQRILKLNEGLDLDQNGIDDIIYQLFDAGTRSGLEGCRELEFLSDQESLHTSMFKLPDQPDFNYPSGIIAVTRSNRLILNSSQYTVSQSAEDSIQLTGSGIPDLVQGDLISETGTTLLRAVREKTASDDTVTFFTRPIPLQNAYEVMNIELHGNVEELSAQYPSGMNRSTMSILNQKGIMSLTLPSGVTGHADFDYDLNLSLFVDAKSSISWTKASVSSEIRFDAKAKAVIDAYVNKTFSENYRIVLAEPKFSFFVGPVPVDVSAELAIGSQIDFNGYGKLKIGGGFDASLGMKAGAGVWVEWDWWDTTIRSKAYCTPVSNFTSYKVGPECELYGKAVFEPYFEIVPKVTIAKIVTGHVTLRTYVEGSGEVKLSTATESKVAVKLIAGIKGIDPGLWIGVDIYGWKIGKGFVFDAKLFDLNTVLINQEYTFKRPPMPVTADPFFAGAGGMFAGSAPVTIYCSTEEAQIRYTTDGSDPTPSTGILYTGTFNLTTSAEIRAIAYREDWENSHIVTKNYLIVSSISKPSFSMTPGVYTGSEITVNLSVNDPSVIRYTTDGSDPTEFHGILYAEPVTIEKSTIIKAVSYIENQAISEITELPVELKMEAPAFSIEEGIYPGPQSVRILIPEGTQVRYTTDGSLPDPDNGILYHGEIIDITSGQSVHIYAIAYRPGCIPSDIAGALYIVE